jgi:hypothetical protein
MKHVLLFLIGWLSILLLVAQPQPDPFERHELKVYPNPSANGQFTLELSLAHPQQAVTLRVYNLIGGVVYAQSLSQPSAVYKESFSLTDLPKGVYMLEIAIGEKKQLRRLSSI